MFKVITILYKVSTVGYKDYMGWLNEERKEKDQKLQKSNKIWEDASMARNWLQELWKEAIGIRKYS